MAEHDINSIAFPTLEPERLAALDKCSLTKRRRYRDGEALFRFGDRDGHFFVVISGAVEIVDESGDTPKHIALHGPGQFAGDVSQITGRPAIVSGYARGDTEVYAVSQPALREL